jgi:hypothetical protein
LVRDSLINISMTLYESCIIVVTEKIFLSLLTINYMFAATITDGSEDITSVHYSSIPESELAILKRPSDEVSLIFFLIHL